LENKRSENDKMFRRMWKIVKTEVGERKKKRRKRKGEKRKEVKKD